MKKLLFLLAFICYNVLCIAQIQNKILGAELGATTTNDLKEILRSKNIVYKYNPKDSTFTANNVTFSNIQWNEVGFITVDDKLVAVMFIDKDNPLAELT